eukprot:CAMPEP_0113588960 /NCGR_PEP_ID=MMETSP0015_2-20120614/35818_1 /TAXON_ID=2838 /ORGANISM="Odontella" /LENGTH=73 /DNA_ID=CAMNT_0000494917 /DNA_START=97 /DNA_END=315 /DNA_ORIENTATION=+ /assembly_acc=CAM_ASM_000160
MFRTGKEPRAEVATRKEPKTNPSHGALQPTNDAPEYLVSSLQLLDPILQFLTKATGQSLIPLSTLRKAVPSSR